MPDVMMAGDGLLGLLGSIGLMVAGWLSHRYIIPFLSVGKRHRYAEYIARIADDLTDELVARYPDKEWLAHLNEAVDRLIEIVGVSPEIARRAINAAAARK